MLKIRITPRVVVTPFLLLVAVSCLCSWLNLMAMPHMITAVMSLSNRVLLAVWIVGIVPALIRRSRMPIPRNTVWGLVVIGFSVASWLMAVSEQPAGAGENMLRLFGFLTLPMMLIYSMLFRIDDRAKTVIFIYGVMISMLFIRLYHSDMRNVYTGEYGITHLDEVTLGYFNPNQAAMYLFVCALILFTGMFYFKSKYLKALFVLDGCYISWIMLQTEARTAALLLAVFGVLSVVAVKRRITGRWVDFALFAPAGYVLLWPILTLLQQNVTIMNDSLFNGRETLFEWYFQSLSVFSFFFGDMNTFALANLHNGYVAIAASMGIVVCLGYVFALKSVLTRYFPAQDGPLYERVAYIGFLCVIMYSCGEGSFFVGGSNFAILPFMLFLLCIHHRVDSAGMESDSRNKCEERT